MRRQYHGGQNARDWRRTVAAYAARQRESVFTYKFSLDTGSGAIDFDAAARAYDIAEGIARGSLIGLLCAVHLSGFRLFSKEAETRQFRNRARYPRSDFAAALKTCAGIDNTRVTIEAIEDVFCNPPRSKGGVAPPWSEDAFAVRLFQKWNRRSPRDGERSGAEFVIASGIGRAIVLRFGGWKELTADTSTALACADDYLQSLGPFPKLGSLPPEANVLPESCTLAYDARAPFVEMVEDSEDIWLHKVVSVCAAGICRSGQEPTTSGLNEAVVTASNNGLQWLFGKGWRYLRENTVEKIAEDLSVPEPEFRRVRQLKAFADAIPRNPFFDTDSYAEFRGSTGGRVSSWVTNYWQRLDQLNELHDRPPEIGIPEALHKPENGALFSDLDTDAASLEARCAQLAERVQSASESLTILRGGGIPDDRHISEIGRAANYVADLAGQIAMLSNGIDQEIEYADNGRAVELKDLKESLTKGAKLAKPPKLNSISGGTDDAEGEIGRLERDFNAAIQARRERYRILAAATGAKDALDPLPVMVEQERRLLSKCGDNPDRADEQALLRLLHEIAGMSRRLAPAMAGRVRDAMTPLFVKRKEANRYFHNRQGTIYRRPFSNSRHTAYKLCLERARQTDWLSWLEHGIEETRRKLLRNDKQTDLDLLRDLLTLEGFVFSKRLRGLPESVPGEAARPGSGEGVPEIPALLAAQLEAETVPRDVALRAFNLFGNAINGLSFRVFRDSFIVRVRFQRLGRDELFYAPKDRAWRPPADYASAKGSISAGLGLPAVTRDKDGAVLPLPTAEALGKAGFPPGSHDLLRQMPHDWFVECDLRSGDPACQAGLPLKKNRDGLKKWRRAKRPAFRLVGPPSFKTWLGRALTDSKVKLGDYTLILDRVFHQSARLEGEEIRLSATPVNLRAELAVPVIDHRPYPDAERGSIFDHIVAIDLGEKRIGFAVFSLAGLLDSGVVDPVETGTVAVPAFRRLMAAVGRHRGSRQPNQKVGQSYSKALMRFRENVIGDVCNRIDTLCERYGAFPVLESSVGNFESGGRRLSMIYGSVLRRYVYSEVKAHKAARSHYWFTADTWSHPYIRIRQWDGKTRKYSGAPKPLKMFPGVSVHPAGTSQQCHRCGRNALAALRAMPARIEIENGGRVVVADGAIRLLERSDYSKKALKVLRRNKQRPPLNAPPRQGWRPRDCVERLLRRNMRQAPKSEMSPDTMQARFVCVYEDCGFDGHADENAAINIGRRFLERIDIERSREKRPA